MANNCYCWILELIFLLLMMSRAPIAKARPLAIAPQSDLIAGNEFLKLILERDEVQRNIHSDEYEEGKSGSDNSGSSKGGRSQAYNDDQLDDNYTDRLEEFKTALKSGSDDYDVEANARAGVGSGSGSARRGTSARSLDYKVKNGGGNSNTNNDEESKQVVKLVTSGSKIVFLEEYDDADDAVVDAVAREIDLQKEKKQTSPTNNFKPELQHPQRQQHHHQSRHIVGPNDEVKVVAVSVSSSSKRGSPPNRTRFQESTMQDHKFPDISHSDDQMSKLIDRRQHQQSQQRHEQHKERTYDRTTSSTTTSKPTTRMTTRAVTTTKRTKTSTTTQAVPVGGELDFVNRSHKSEFSIEETEPHTQSPLKLRGRHPTNARTVDSTTLDEFDSENSASTNIQNVLAAPLTQAGGAASMRSNSLVSGIANVNAYLGSNRNITAQQQTHINQASLISNSHVTSSNGNSNTHDSNSDLAIGISSMSSQAASASATDDKLLPFQTVIYHDNNEGRGPQSRSISYSSISQNVDDLQKWQRSGILAEAQRNVSESLKPIPRPQTHPHTSEPAKFYSMPAKMYGIPAKFYSEPAKVYSEPSKVYGQPEKFYSEPAKVYGQPSKFYSEPSKVYSQPAKVYGEPAKTYWPHAVTTSSTTTTTTTLKPTTTTTTAPNSLKYTTTITPINYPAARRPAIVSRIAFGEAQTTTTTTTTTTNSPQIGFGQGLSTITPSVSYHQHRVLHGHHAQVNSPPRRVLFNLDKLPYDLLNSPEQSSKRLLEPDAPKAPTDFEAHREQHPCYESQQQQHTQQRQHSSLSDQQHSNQNAKGLPNRDLVKCFSKYSHSSAAAAASFPSSSSSSFSASGSYSIGVSHHHQQQQQQQQHYTTERSHIEDLYTPTPEQNYEIEESVSVMTNGRAHGVQSSGLGSSGGGTGFIQTTTIAPPRTPTRSRVRFGSALMGPGTGSRGTDGVQYNTNANANIADNAEDHNNNNNNYDDDSDVNSDVVADGDVDVDDATGSKNAGNSDDDGGNGDDDSKVAYVVEGRNYRKYRVEEKTDDGFIVGEYGVVDHLDGNLRGVRYTADSTINRSLIQKALLTFLKLK